MSNEIGTIQLVRRTDGCFAEATNEHDALACGAGLEEALGFEVGSSNHGDTLTILIGGAPGVDFWGNEGRRYGERVLRLERLASSDDACMLTSWAAREAQGAETVRVHRELPSALMALVDRELGRFGRSCLWLRMPLAFTPKVEPEPEPEREPVELVAVTGDDGLTASERREREEAERVRIAASQRAGEDLALPHCRHPDRLMALAAFLRNEVHDDWFDLNSWWGGVGDAGMDSAIAFSERRCGTTACAMGWAPQVPALAHLVRLRLPRRDSNMWGFQLTAEAVGRDEGERFFHDDGIAAGCRLFGITNNASHQLFGPSTYDEDEWPQDRLGVADRIERFALFGESLGKGERA